MWPFLNDFILPAAWCVFVRKHCKVCCSLLQWSNIGTAIWCRTCTVRFFRSLLRIFSSFPPIWVCKMKVLWKVASSHAKDLKPVFLILIRVQHEEFYYNKAISCKSYMQLLIQDLAQFHQKLVSYNCMLFVDCLLVLQEYFVNWARVTKFQFLFLEVLFVLKVMSDVMFATQLLL